MDQWPCGAESSNRSPPLHRPRSRVIFVFAPLSSMKTKRDGSIRRVFRAHQRRLRFTSGRSCSAARRVFFCDDTPDASACCAPSPGCSRPRNARVTQTTSRPAVGERLGPTDSTGVSRRQAGAPHDALAKHTSHPSVVAEVGDKPRPQIRQTVPRSQPVSIRPNHTRRRYDAVNPVNKTSYLITSEYSTPKLKLL